MTNAGQCIIMTRKGRMKSRLFCDGGKWLAAWNGGCIGWIRKRHGDDFVFVPGYSLKQGG